MLQDTLTPQLPVQEEQEALQWHALACSMASMHKFALCSMLLNVHEKQEACQQLMATERIESEVTVKVTFSAGGPVMDHNAAV